jgi:hypothetical protein
LNKPTKVADLRSALGIFLLISIGFPALGTYASLHYQKQRVKREVRAALLLGIAPAQLIRLAFTLEQTQTLLRWEHAQEFEYQGQMYDVQSRQDRGDSIVLWCWQDEKETLLNQKLDQWIVKVLTNDPRRRETQGQCLDFYKTLYYHTPQDLSLHSDFPTRFLAQVALPAASSWYSRMLAAPPAPPPQAV